MSLCLECGFCCDGTLFSKVPLEPGEAVPFAAVGASLGDPHFAQPCPVLRGTACCVYEARPKTCRKFRCAALEGLEGGRSTLEESRAALAEVRARREVIASLVAAPTPGAAVVAARALVREQRATPELAEAVGRLERLVLLLNL